MEKQALNPFLPLHEYIPDGEPRVFGDRLYLYGSHDEAGETEFCINDYVLWSTPVDDLSAWKYEGVIYKRDDDPLGNGSRLAAPDCVQGSDGRYYLYYNPSSIDQCGVAVSDTPTGPFTFLAHVAYLDGTYPDTKLFDPGVLVDDDNQVYLYTGFVPTADSYLSFLPVKFSVGFRLAKDMYTILEGPVELIPGEEKARGTGFEKHGFYEASSPRKIDGAYYLVYSSEQSHDLCYAVSQKPLGPYVYGGVLVSNADIGMVGNIKPLMPYGNTHGGLVQIKDTWYIFYHRHTHGIECCRQGCAEKVKLDGQGQYGQAEITSCGLNGEALIGKGIYNACYACHLTAPSIGKERLTVRKCVRDEQPHIYQEKASEKEKEPLHYIANIVKGTVVGYKYFSFIETNRIAVKLRCTCAGKVTVYTDVELTTQVAELLFESTEGKWETCEVAVKVLEGIMPLYFLFEFDVRVDFMEFILR